MVAEHSLMLYLAFSGSLVFRQHFSWLAPTSIPTKNKASCLPNMFRKKRRASWKSPRTKGQREYQARVAKELDVVEAYEKEIRDLSDRLEAEEKKARQYLNTMKRMQTQIEDLRAQLNAVTTTPTPVAQPADQTPRIRPRRVSFVGTQASDSSSGSPIKGALVEGERAAARRKEVMGFPTVCKLLTALKVEHSQQLLYKTVDVVAQTTERGEVAQTRTHVSFSIASEDQVFMALLWMRLYPSQAFLASYMGVAVGKWGKTEMDPWLTKITWATIVSAKMRAGLVRTLRRRTTARTFSFWTSP